MTCDKSDSLPAFEEAERRVCLRRREDDQVKEQTSELSGVGVFGTHAHI